ncbi:hypothetical protein CJF26_21240 [Photobacterium phosphoreum]|nr:hypothetical protein [Photobacterium phosphoreum]
MHGYGKLVRIEFLKYLREEEKFPDLSIMISAIGTDVQNAKDYLALHGL